MDTKYTYILLLTVIITMTLVHGHIVNPAAEIGWFMNKLVSRFSVNLNTHTHTHINTKTYTFLQFFFSPYSQKMLVEISERIGKMSLEELCEISYDPKNCCHISYNPENCCDISYDLEYCWTFIMKNNLKHFLRRKKKKRNKNHKNKVIQFKQSRLSFGYCHENKTSNICEVMIVTVVVVVTNYVETAAIQTNNTKKNQNYLKKWETNN